MTLPTTEQYSDLERRLSEAEARADALAEALFTILANTEPDAIKHRDYDHLAHDICETARAALQGGKNE